MINEKTKQGGSRPGAGAKKKYGEGTKVLSIRVPASKQDALKKQIKKWLQTYKTKNN